MKNECTSENELHNGFGHICWKPDLIYRVQKVTALGACD